VADHHKRRKAEALAALHGLRHAVDVDELLDQLLATVLVVTTTTTVVTTATTATITAATPASTAGTASTAAASARRLAFSLNRSGLSRRGFSRSLIGAFL